MGFVIQVSDPQNVTKPVNEIAPKDDDSAPLTEEQTAKALHTLGRTADGLSQAYLGCNLILQHLNNIDVLQSYIHIQDLDISCNSLTDISSLSELKYLVRLNASYNRLSTVLGFDPPFNLDYANFNNNNIHEIQDLTAHKYLTELHLDNNQISEIQGLGGLSSLKVLSLQSNRISEITGLDNLPLQKLSLGANRLSTLNNLQSNTSLREIYISDNTISSFKGLEMLTSLQVIEAQHNKITYLESLEALRSIPLLKALNLAVNAIQEVSKYKLRVLEIAPSLVTLDYLPVAAEDKVRAQLAAEESAKTRERLAAERAAADAQEAKDELNRSIQALRLNPVILVQGLPATNVHWAGEDMEDGAAQALRINPQTEYIFRVLFGDDVHRLEIDYQMTEDDEHPRVMKPEQRSWINSCINVHGLALAAESEYSWTFDDKGTIAKLSQLLYM